MRREMSSNMNVNCRFATIDVSELADVSVTEAAEVYARNRISIVPVAADDSKLPLIKWKAYQRQAPSVSMIERWFTRDFPEASIGIVTGKLNGLIVVDIDAALDCEFFFERYPEARNTLTIVTPRGLHLYFQHRDGAKNNVSILGRKIDIRTSGGYVRAPTSAGYRFSEKRPILASPVELLADISNERVIRQCKTTPHGELILQGYRNDTVFRIACGLQATGYSDAQIFKALLHINNSRVLPPLPITELESILRSVTGRYPKGTAARPAATTSGYVEAGDYICRAIGQHRVARKNRESQVVEWQDIESGRVFPQYFNTYARFSPRSKAVVNYVLLFGELPKRLDRVDFARFIGVTAFVRIGNSRPSPEWGRRYPGLTMPELLTESRVTDVICALPNTDNK
jgi:hypothetical protein